MRYVIWGWAVVFDPEGNEITDLKVLRQLAGFVDEEDFLATDYIGGSPEEDAIASALEPSGRLRFAIRDGEPSLRVFNEYLARRSLSPAELQWLRTYTLGQWSDGMGECIFVPNGPLAGCKLQPLGEDEVAVPEYPFVEVLL